MRGRGFTIRQSGQPASGSGASSVVGASGAAPGGGSSLLGPGGRADVFRSRPQNTSRPPSLHVDDFNKLEKDEANPGASGAGTSATTAGHEVGVVTNY